MRVGRFIPLVIALVLLVAVSTVLIVQPGQAQTEGGECATLVEAALTEVGNHCTDMPRNSACYGFNHVAATFTQTVADDFFTSPSDKTDLVQLQTIQTAPLDAALEQWGVAVMKVQANVPNTLPGQGVVFLLMGDTHLENAVPAEEAIVLGDAISVTTLVGANIRSGPGTNSNVLGSAPPGTELPADGLSPDGEWLRVLFQHTPAWVSRQVIDTDGDVTSLPIITAQSRTPVQAFYFSTGVGDPACNEAPPSLLVVQGPQNVTVEISANGAEIRLGSTIVLWLLPEQEFQLLALDGGAYVGNLIVPAGFTITGKLGEDGRNFTGEWVQLRPMTPDELTLLLPLENLPANLLNYPVHVPTIAEVQQTAALVSSPTSSGGSTVLAPGLADCSSFAPTSPLGGLAYGTNTFYWDPAPGATHYRVDVLNSGGQVATSFTTDAGSTSVTGSLDVDSVGTDLVYSWRVVALVNGRETCMTASVTTYRSAPPPPAQQGKCYRVCIDIPPTLGSPGPTCTFIGYNIPPCTTVPFVVTWQCSSLPGGGLIYEGC